MRKNFRTEFLNSIKKIPFIEGAKLVSFHFSIVYPKDTHREPKNILLAKYQNNIKLEEMEILIQSPKDHVLKDINISDFKSIRIGGKKVYINYDPKVKFFPSHLPYDFYTLIRDKDLITIATNEQKFIKSIKINRSLKFKPKILGYLDKIPDEIYGFTKCFVKFNREVYRGYLNILFYNSIQKTEIRVDIFEDEEETIEEVINDVITRKKEINNLLTKGETGGRDLVFCRLDKNRILVTRNVKAGDNLLVNFTKKIVQKIK